MNVLESPLTKVESVRIKPMLDKLEHETLESEGLANINGGFAGTDVIDYNSECISVRLQWGIQCGSDHDYCHEDILYIDRETMDWED
jgi:hypothetical protein